MDDRLYFRQLLAGRDIAVGDPIARQMVNFVYLIGDRETGEAVVIDPAYDIPGPARRARRRRHAPHRRPRHALPPGPRRRLDDGPLDRRRRRAARPRARADPRAGRRGPVRHPGHRRAPRPTSWPTRAATPCMVGEIPIELIHTPGHTPGQPVLLRRRLPGQRRHALPRGLRPHRPPGRRPRRAYDSLTHKLAKVPDDAVLFPGHLYSAEPSATMAETRRWNFVFTPSSEAGVAGDVRR